MSDPRSQNFTTSSGTNVRNTSQLKGEAKKSPVENEKNQIKQYVPQSGAKGPFGGRNQYPG